MSAEDIKAKIRGLLNIAKDDAASENEIETALKIAQKMMERHHLSEYDLTEDPLAQMEQAANAPKTKEAAELGSKIYTWEVILAEAVARHIVKGVGWYSQKTNQTPSGLIRRNEHGKPIQFGQIMFYGVAEDVEIARRIFTEIRTAIIALARLRYGSVFRGDGAAYAEGFATGLKKKSIQQDTDEREEAQKRLTTTSDNRGLILLSRRTDLIRRKEDSAKKWLASPAGGGIRLATQSRGGSSGDDSARQQGMKDGAGYGVSATRSKKLC
jgi:hypothetical protein